MLVLCLAAIVEAVLRYARQRWRTFVPLGAFHDGPADDYELAMLTGGRDLVVLVALLNLESVGALELARRESRLSRPGAPAASDTSIVASVGWLEPSAHPTETAVFRAVLAGSESEASVAANVAVGAALGDLQQRLVVTGLLDPPPPPAKLGDGSQFDDFHLRSLLGHELARRLRRNHPVESVGTLVALFRERMLAKVDPELACARAPRPAVISWRKIALSLRSGLGGDGGEVDTSGTW